MSNNVVFAILKRIGGKIRVAEGVKDDYLICSPDEFKKSMIKKILAILVIRSKKRFILGRSRKYTEKEIETAFNSAFDDWTNEFKKQTIYMK